MEDPVADTGQRRPRRGHMVAVVIILAAALVATVAFVFAQGSQDASRSIDAVVEATRPTLATYRTQAADAGGSITVTWSASPMADGHMVEARIESAVPEYRGKAVFMVEDDAKRITAQDLYAASLLGRGTQAAPHK